MKPSTSCFVDRSSSSLAAHVKGKHPAEETLLVQVTARYSFYEK